MKRYLLFLCILIVISPLSYADTWQCTTLDNFLDHMDDITDRQSLLGDMAEEVFGVDRDIKYTYLVGSNTYDDDIEDVSSIDDDKFCTCYDKVQLTLQAHNQGKLEEGEYANSICEHASNEQELALIGLIRIIEEGGATIRYSYSD